MKRLLTLIALFLFAGIISSNAENYFKLTNNVVGVAGQSQILIEVEIVNTINFDVFQFDLVWPAGSGFTFVAGSGALSASRRVDHALSAVALPLGAPGIRVLAFSFTNASFLGNSGTIMSFMVDASNVPAGVYPFEFTGTQIISDPENVGNQWDYSINGTVTLCNEISFEETITNVSCFGGNDGAIDVEIEGGVGQLTYSWTGPDDFESEEKDISELYAGEYILTVTDALGCKSTETYIVEQPTSALTATITGLIHVKCFGEFTGEITVLATTGAGTAPYQYKLDDGDYQESGSFSNLAAGNYVITVKDANDCLFEVPVSITEPDAALAASIISQTNVNCFGNSTGSVTVLATSGTGISPYQYKLDDGDYQESGTFADLLADSYIVTVKDANDCTVEIPVTITQPDAALEVSLTSQTDVICFGDDTGAIVVSVTGGTGAYTFMWTGPGTYSSTLQNPTGLIAGEYNLNVTDQNNCSVSLSPAVLITQNPAVESPVGVSTEVFYNGNPHSASATAPSGSTLKWYDAATNGNVIPDISTVLTQTDVGVYRAWASSVHNTTGCESDERTEVVLTINPNYGDANCDGAINVLDIQRMVAFINEVPSLEPFCFVNADAFTDGSINGLDISAVIIIINQQE